MKQNLNSILRSTHHPALQYNYAPAIATHLEQLVQMDHVCGFSSHDLLFTESTTQATAAAAEPNSPSPSVDADRIERAASKAQAMLTSESQLLATPKSVKKARRTQRDAPEASPVQRRTPPAKRPAPVAQSPVVSQPYYSPAAMQASAPATPQSKAAASPPVSSPPVSSPPVSIPLNSPAMSEADSVASPEPRMLPELEASDTEQQGQDADNADNADSDDNSSERPNGYGSSAPDQADDLHSAMDDGDSFVSHDDDDMLPDNHTSPAANNTHFSTASTPASAAIQSPVLSEDRDDSFHSCSGAPRTPMLPLRSRFAINGTLFDSPASFIMSPVARIDMTQPEHEPEPVDADEGDATPPHAHAADELVCPTHRLEVRACLVRGVTELTCVL